MNAIIKFSPILLFLIIFSINCKKDKIKETLFSTPEITEYTDSSVVAEVNVLIKGTNLKNFGFCCGTSPEPTVNNSKTVHSADELNTGTISDVISGLNPNTTYYIRVYAEEDGIQYDEDEISFTTSYVINFPDLNLEKAVRDKINKPEGDIYASDVDKITEFTAENAGIASIAGIQYFSELQNLDLDMNQISDLSPLEGLSNLSVLSLQDNQISDISTLAVLSSLTHIVLGRNQISDISILSDLTNLTGAELFNNQISDITPLSGLTNLTSLGLELNQISDISVLSGLTNLKSLCLSYNQISDITPLEGLSNLEYLYLNYNDISNISAITHLPNLIYLFLYNNQISDITSLAGLTNINVLYIQDNQISDISPLSGNTSVQYLKLDENQIVDISPLSGLTNIIKLDLDYNQIIDIYPLVQNSGMDNGDALNLLNNPLSTTSVNDYIPELQARGVDVTY